MNIGTQKSSKKIDGETLLRIDPDEKVDQQNIKPNSNITNHKAVLDPVPNDYSDSFHQE